MKIIHCVLFLMFVCFKSWFFSQTSEISQIQEMNQLIVKETAAFDFKKASLNNEISFSKKRMENFEMLANKLQLSLEKFEVNQSNIDVFISLKDKIIYVPTDYSDKKSKKSVKKLNDNFKILLDTNYFKVGKNLVYYEKDKRGKAIQLKELELDSKTSKMIQKLNFKEIYSPISNSKLPADLNITAAFLFKLTGVNEDYFLIKNEIGKMKDSISIENDLIKTNTEKIEELQKDLASSITGIKDKIKTLEEQLRKIEDEQIRLKKIEQEKAIAQQNSELYKCKNINGVDIYLNPILIKEFRNGDIIREARTPGEWSDFILNKVPAFKYEDFDSKNTLKGLIYNYYAFKDIREISPVGFHKLNILDFVYIEGQNVGEFKKVTVDCYCKDGMQDTYTSCQYCNHWTKDQKKYNICPKCNNKELIYKGKEKCSLCNGTRKYTSDQCELCEKKDLKLLIANDFSKFDYVVNNLDGDEELFYKCQFPFAKIEFDKDQVRIQDYGYYSSRKDEVINGNYRFILCKDRKNKILASNTLDFQEIEIMNTFLDVTKFKNGDNIKYIEDDVEWELALRDGIPAYCYFNNDKSSRNCFYNVHAINDKRGLIPEGWRSITSQDIRYIEFIKGKKFDFDNNTCPVNRPLGYRNQLGKFNFYNEESSFNEFNFQASEGYILCVKEKNIDNFLKSVGDFNMLNEVSDKKWITIIDSNKIKIDNYVKNSKIIDGFNNKTGDEILNNNYRTKLKLNLNGDRVSDYNSFYNNEGQEILNRIYKSGWKELFDKNNGKIEFVDIENNLKCDFITCCGNVNYVYGYGNKTTMDAWILTRNEKFAKYELKVKIIKVNIKNGAIEIIEDNLIQLNEITFYLAKSKEKVKFNFDVNSCNASDNPIDNFYMNNMTRLSWIDNKINGAYWTENHTKAFEVLKSQINIAKSQNDTTITQFNVKSSEDSNVNKGNSIISGVSGNQIGDGAFGSGKSGGGSGPGPGRNDVSVNGIGNGAFGSGDGPGKSRTRLNNVSLPSYDIDYDCNISFKLTINENGDVESASCIKSRTTCVDQRIINQVISEIVKQVKYDKSIGSNLTFAFLTISISSR